MEDKLIQLVASLSKAEKRNFKLFINRNRKESGQLKQSILFDFIERWDTVPDKEMKKLFPGISNKNIHELCALLYKNILKSLRLLDSGEADYKIQEQLDFAHLLYRRGLFADSLELLAQAKKSAKKHQKYFLVYEIIDFEKKIESRHVTKSHDARAIELTTDAMETRIILESEGHWTELSLRLYDFYLKSGHSKNSEERLVVEQMFRENWPETKEKRQLQFYEQLYFYQSHVWYYYINQDFAKGFQYAVKWINLFEQFPSFIVAEKFQLLKGYHNCLSVLFYCQDVSRFTYYQQKMEQFIDEYKDTFDKNTRLMGFIYINLAKLNAIVLKGTFSASRDYLQELETALMLPENQVDHHRTMIFQYKMSTIYFTMGDHKKTIQLLHPIINYNQGKLHEDVQSFARILNLIAHYEQGNIDLIYFQVKSVYRFLLKLDETQAVQREIISFLKKVINLPENEVPNHFIDFHTKLSVINTNKLESRAFLYLDILSWLESKIEGKTVELVISKKCELKMNRAFNQKNNKKR